jgi:hypothetical protein
MAETRPVIPVKFFIAVLYLEPAMSDVVIDRAAQIWGAIDFRGAAHLFDVTAYYEPEMGAPLYRCLHAFETLRDPMALVEMKLRCNELEKEHSREGRRLVNLDAGYLDHNKVVLASAKDAGQKIYLGSGIYADLAGRYKAGKYQPFEWSFPDFRDGRYDEDLLHIRTTYMRQLKNS